MATTVSADEVLVVVDSPAFARRLRRVKSAVVRHAAEPTVAAEAALRVEVEHAMEMVAVTLHAAAATEAGEVGEVFLRHAGGRLPLSLLESGSALEAGVHVLADVAELVRADGEGVGGRGGRER